MIQKAFRDDAMSTAQIKVWHKCFKDGGKSVESDPCSGRPAEIFLAKQHITQVTQGPYIPDLVL